jgi:galactose oxidase-like protein
MQRATKIFRIFLHPGFVSLLTFGAFGSTTIATAQSPGMFTATGNMTTSRALHTATLLTNGKVLIAGGVESSNGLTSSAELYDPANGSFAATGNMTTPRSLHTATLLPDGRVLIAGGSTGKVENGVGQLHASAELYDPDTGTFAATGDMSVARYSHTATLLNDGKVLIAGGWDSHGLVSAELYDPSTGSFTAAGNVTVSRFSPPTATLLPDGTVLLASPAGDCRGLFAAGGELHDPLTSTFTHKGVANYCTPYWHTASLLPNGLVLIAGGGDADIGVDLSNATLYNPVTGTFAATSNMSTPRYSHTATVLSDGTVLITGGYYYLVASAEVYDSSTSTFRTTGDMTTGRAGHTATLLSNGEVLIAGGFDAPRRIRASAELYHPPLSVPMPALFSLSGDGKGQGAILHGGTSQVASSSNPATVGEALEIYCTGLIDAAVIPPQVAIGGRIVEVLFFGKAPGFAGLNQSERPRTERHFARICRPSAFDLPRPPEQ